MKRGNRSIRTLCGTHKPDVYKMIQHPMCTAALPAIAKKWKPPKCLSANDWIEEIRYTHPMEYYSAMKRVKTCHL
jgi:hypothetical protein